MRELPQHDVDVLNSNMIVGGYILELRPKDSCMAGKDLGKR